VEVVQVTREADQDDTGDTAKKVKGDVKEVLGAVTGDRRVEATGRAEQRVADADDPAERTDDATVEEEHAVRRAHGDLSDGGQADTPLGT
jgi:uncharacterized protein YjbJ (UPF0337 family)